VSDGKVDSSNSRIGHRLDRPFLRVLGLIFAGGLTLRVLYVLVATRHEATGPSDVLWYEAESLQLVKGHFFPGPTANHPPLTSFAITPVTYLFGLHPGQTPQRLTMAVLGALVVLVVGYLGRIVAGPSVGLIAAGVAAVYPNMWIYNGIVLSETLTILMVALILLMTYRMLAAPTWLNATLLGLGCGLEMLVRPETILLLPFLLIPAALACKSLSPAGRMKLAAIGVLVACITIGPWVGRNLVSFTDTTFLSTNGGSVVDGANCQQTYQGPSIGSWNFACAHQLRPMLSPSAVADESVVSTRQLANGVWYMEHHLSQLPLVVLAREGRVWELFDPIQGVDYEEHHDTHAALPFAFAGLFMYYLLLPAAVFGVVALRRRRTSSWPLLVPVVLVTAITAVTYGIVRFRAEAEVSLVVLAAVGLEASWSRWVRRTEPERVAERLEVARP
jgi:4-amino-4-deoxy-L-arabinose transferase-like glycosyltransferase